MLLCYLEEDILFTIQHPLLCLSLPKIFERRCFKVYDSIGIVVLFTAATLFPAEDDTSDNKLGAVDWALVELKRIRKVSDDTQVRESASFSRISLA